MAFYLIHLLKLGFQSLKLPKPNELVHGKVAPSSEGASEFADAMQVCSCNNVTKREPVVAIVAGELSTVPEVSAATKAGKGCGGCVPMVSRHLSSILRYVQC